MVFGLLRQVALATLLAPPELFLEEGDRYVDRANAILLALLRVL